KESGYHLGRLSVTAEAWRNNSFSERFAPLSFSRQQAISITSFFTTLAERKTLATLQFSAKQLNNLSLLNGQHRLVAKARAVHWQPRRMLSDRTDAFFRPFW